MDGARGARGVTLSPWGLLLLWNVMQQDLLVRSAPAPASPELPFGVVHGAQKAGFLCAMCIRAAHSSFLPMVYDVSKYLEMITISRTSLEEQFTLIHGLQEGQFWHITDLHLDPTYHITINRTQVCASSKGVNASSPGLFGDFMCDSPYKLILSALKYMKDSGQQASFMIWTGDSPPHVPPTKLSTKIVIDIIGNMTSTIRSFFPGLQVFPALGNHDYWPQNQLPASVNEVYSAVADFWKPWLTDEAVSTLRKGGFYTQKVRSSVTSPPLRIISLNTILYYGPNTLTRNMTDPANQLEWLEQVLKMALWNKEKVYVIGHVPVGYLPFVRNKPAIREYYNERLIEIFRRYSSVIAGQFFGHTHRDSIMILLDKKGKPVNSLFVAPAVTPVKSLWEVDSNNPGVRLYQYDPLSYSVLDLWQFYLNLTEANMKNESDWKLEYVMTEAYGIEDLKPESLQGMVKELSVPHSKLFPKYYNNFFVSYDGNKFCEKHCRVTQLCAIQFLDLPSYTDCIGNEDMSQYE